jgi:hypothetical protein
MKVFLGFGYNPRDQWVKDLIKPLLIAMGCEVVTGEDLAGQPIAAGVLSRIKESDACIGLLTRRDDPDGDGIFTTHQWVVQELSAALANDIPMYPILEKGVDPQLGVFGAYQYYPFDENTRANVLVEIARFITQEKAKQTYKTFMLLPPDFSEKIRPVLKHTKCTYRFWHKAKEYEPQEAELKKMPSGFGVLIKRIPGDDASIDIKVDGPAGTWSSGYVTVGSINVHLSQDN